LAAYFTRFQQKWPRIARITRIKATRYRFVDLRCLNPCNPRNPWPLLSRRLWTIATTRAATVTPRCRGLLPLLQLLGLLAVFLLQLLSLLLVLLLELWRPRRSGWGRLFRQLLVLVVLPLL